LPSASGRWSKIFWLVTLAALSLCFSLYLEALYRARRDVICVDIAVDGARRATCTDRFGRFSHTLRISLLWSAGLLSGLTDVRLLGLSATSWSFWIPGSSRGSFRRLLGQPVLGSLSGSDGGCGDVVTLSQGMGREPRAEGLTRYCSARASFARLHVVRKCGFRI